MGRISLQMEALADLPVVGRLICLPAKLRWPPNLWTTLRLIGIIFVIPAFSLNYYLGLVCFCFMLLTDGIDGMLARKKGYQPIIFLDPLYWLYLLRVISLDIWLYSGRWYDALADKVFIISSFFYFGFVINPITIIDFQLFIIMIIIELSGRLIIIPFWRKVIRGKELYIPSNILGKAKFGIESIVGILVLLSCIINYSGLIEIIYYLMWLIISLSVGSIIGHVYPEKFMQLKLLNFDPKLITTKDN